MKCVNKRCYVQGSLNRHVNVGINHPEPESGYRKYDEHELEKCICFLNESEKTLQWFAGNGWQSGEDADVLRAELDEALTIIGGLQQPIHADSEEAFSKQKSQDQEEQKRLQEIANHIYESLTGERI